jgi:hypothetical protein
MAGWLLSSNLSSGAVISSQVAQGGNEFDPLRHTLQSQPYQVSSVDRFAEELVCDH